jgi:hypothetical protein
MDPEPALKLCPRPGREPDQFVLGTCSLSMDHQQQRALTLAADDPRHDNLRSVQLIDNFASPALVQSFSQAHDDLRTAERLSSPPAMSPAGMAQMDSDGGGGTGSRCTARRYAADAQRAAVSALAQRTDRPSAHRRAPAFVWGAPADADAAG